jgi:glycosyltransferase involved in cell wall biosynthesis
VLFVGELDTRKRGRLLLRAFAERVRAAWPDAELWAVCPERAEGPGVRWLGQVSAPELARLYGTAWVFCLPSSYEGFGRPYVEAMAAGTPVVATPNAGAREILEDGRHGLVVREGELGEAIATVLGRPDLRRHYADRGRARARRYAWELVAEQYEDAYDTACRRAPRPSAA